MPNDIWLRFTFRPNQVESTGDEWPYLSCYICMGNIPIGDSHYLYGICEPHADPDVCLTVCTSCHEWAVEQEKKEAR